MLRFGLLAAVICGCVVLLAYHTEGFRQGSVLVLRDKHRQNIVMKSSDYDASVANFVSKLPTKYYIARDARPVHTDMVYDDLVGYGLQARAFKAKYAVVACTDDIKLTAFLRNPDKVVGRGHVRDLANQKIGYVAPQDVIVIRAILMCYDITIADKDLVRFSSYESAAKALGSTGIGTGDIAAVFTFANHNAPDFVRAFRETKIAAYDFEDINAQRARFLLPDGILRNYEFQKTLHKFADRFSVRSTIAFNCVLYCYLQDVPTPYLYDYAIKYFAHNYEMMNYLGSKYTIHPRTRILYDRIDQDAIDRADKNILEQFTTNETLQMTHKPIGNVKGFLNDEKGVFTANTDLIEGIPVAVGDKVVLAAQTRASENGSYVVVGAGAMGAKFKKEAAGVTKANVLEGTCVTNPSILIKDLCESPNDILGDAKVKPDVWDTPCVANTDCPFYQKNTHYKNYRGGCNDGYCEMPLGVERVGYTKHEGEPFCHGCADPNNPRCCKRGGKDYAFAFDEYERLNAPTIVERFAMQPASTEPADGWYLMGDYYDVKKPGVYHYEDDNETVGLALKKLVGVTSDVIPYDMHAFFTDAVNFCFPDDVKYALYSFKEEPRDADDKSQVIFTMYREGKSHGKRVHCKIARYKDGSLTVLAAQVVGVVPQQDIIEYTHSALAWSDWTFSDEAEPWNSDADPETIAARQCTSGAAPL